MINIADHIKQTIATNNGTYLPSLTAIVQLHPQPLEQAYLVALTIALWPNAPGQVAPMLSVTDKAAKTNYNPTAHVIQLNPLVLTSPLIVLDMILFEAGNALQGTNFLNFLNPAYIAANGLLTVGHQKAQTEYITFRDYVQRVQGLLHAHVLNTLPEQAQKSINVWNTTYATLPNDAAREHLFCTTPHRPGAATTTEQMYAAELLKGTAIRDAVLGQCMGVFFIKNANNPFTPNEKADFDKIRKDVSAITGKTEYVTTNVMSGDTLFTTWNRLIDALIQLFQKYLTPLSSFNLRPAQIGAQGIIARLQAARL